MKRVFQFALIAALAISWKSVAVASGPAICDPQQSILCIGLGQVFGFEEATDNPRWDENKGTAWLEADGQNVARAAGKLDSYAASFVGTDGNYLWIPRAGQQINGSTVAFWIYPTSAATEQIILSADESTKHGPYLSIVPSGGNVKIKGVAYYGDGRGDVSVTSTATMTLNAWHLVVWGYDQAEAADFLTTADTGRVMYVQVDNGARDKVGLAYFPIIGPYNDLTLGQRRGSGAGYTMPYSGRVDQLTFATRTWDSVDAAEFYATGSGKAYPFVPSVFDSLNDGLVAYWSFNEASNTTRYDSIGQSNLTDVSSSTAQTAGKLGYAAYADSTDHLMVNDNSVIHFSGTDFTLAGWVNVTLTAQTQYIVAKSDTGLSDYEVLADVSPGGALLFRVANGSCSASGASLSSGAWAFVVLEYTYASKTCKVQVNNGTVYSGTGSVQLSGETQPFYFALAYQTTSFDEWGFWKRVLTTQQKTDLYNSGTGRTYPF